MLRVLIIDDEAPSREMISANIRDHFEDVTIVGTANSVRSGVKAIRSLSPDLVLLDIKLPDGTGFDILTAINDIDFQVIFITAFENHALRAFRVNAIDYLLKPIESPLFINAINKARQKIDSDVLNKKIRKLLIDFSREEAEPIRNRKFKLKANNQVFLLDIDSIIRLESDKNYTLFYIEGREPIVVTRTLKEFEQIFKEYGFLRIHKSHLVNQLHMTSYRNTPDPHIMLKDGNSIPVSTRKKSMLSKFI